MAKSGWLRTHRRQGEPRKAAGGEREADGIDTFISETLSYFECRLCVLICDFVLKGKRPIDF